MNKILNHLRTDWYKYALEMIVITAGILGAFMLNSWNEGMKEHDEKSVLLTNLRGEFLLNKNQLEKRIESTKKIKSRSSSLIGLFTPKFDTLETRLIDSLIVEVANFQTYEGSSGALDDLINNDKLRLLKKDSLRIELASWKESVEDVQERESRVKTVNLNHLMPYLYEHYSLLKIDETWDSYMPKSKLAFDNRTIMDDVQFESILDDYYWQNHFLLVNYLWLQRKQDRIMTMIEEENNK